jgi:hypothetical protein
MGSERSRVRAAIVTGDPVQPQPIGDTPLATWRSDVLIPMTTNSLSGLAVAAGVAIIWYLVAAAQAADLPATWWIPCGAAGALWVVGWTIVRYNGDEIGLFRAAYRAGRRSRDSQVNALMLEIETLRDSIDAGQGSPTSSSERRIATANATLRNARALLRVVYDHGAAQASRGEMAHRGMGQRDWERARRLCLAAGAVDELMQPRAADYNAALRAIEDVHAAGVRTMQASRNSGVAWT